MPGQPNQMSVTRNSYFYNAMNLVVDIGNSFMKVAVYSGMELIALKKSANDDNSGLESVISEYPGLKQAIISSVGPDVDTTSQLLKHRGIKVLVLDESTPIPIENLYLTKDTLGKDRLAAAVGGWTAFGHDPVLIIDAGTALTFDFLDQKGQYIGGSISPGLQMRFQALHHLTKRLPLVQPEAHFTWPASTTNASIVTGVQNGMIMEIEGTVQQYTGIYPGLKAILTGGDALFFDKILKNSIFVDLNLVLKGLNRILIYHAEKR